MAKRHFTPYNRPSRSYSEAASPDPGSAVVAMVQQQSTSRQRVVLSGLAVLVASAAFAGAVYFYDGVDLVRGLIAQPMSGQLGSSEGVSRPETESAPPRLGKDIPEEFALRLWQEQLDSQQMIGSLVDGEFESMRVTNVESSSAEATLGVQVKLRGGTTAKGVLGLRRFKDAWFIAFTTLERNGRTPRPSGPLPDPEDVDMALLNTMFEQQYGGAGVVEEYLAGIVEELTFGEPQRGPNTVTIDAEMRETHGTGYAQVVAVQHEIDGEPYWFLVRFKKTGHDPPDL